jgi:3-oxoacyl-(acyl-carrier-protein) synthase/thioesterase domain-containing protein/SAM-dependent methyltransferase/acyl carrier protein
VRRIGAGLAGVLKGEIDYQKLLFPQGSVDLLQPFYKSNVLASTYTAAMVAAALAVAAQLPTGRRLHVLEIGAGTGGITVEILPVFAPQCERYVCTDVSESSVRRASRRFSQHACLETSVLDIDVDPRLQGFGSHEVDLLIAANALHLVPDMQRALRHCAQLLRPGGVLLISEPTIVTAASTLVLGLDPAWWRFKDDPLRRDRDGPYLTSNEWMRALSCSGLRHHCATDDSGYIGSSALALAAQTARPLQTPSACSINACIRNGSAVITGGLGGLGLLAAREQAARPDVRAVVLASRSGKVQPRSERDWQLLLSRAPVGAGLAGTRESINEPGAPEDTSGECTVYMLCCNVADAPEVKWLIGATAGLGGVQDLGLPMQSVFHAAGVISDGVLANQTNRSLRAVYGPKVHGAGVLHCAVVAHAGLAFALTSSVASLLGAAGQSNHAAASAWLDGLAALRSASGLHGHSAQWGAVAEVGYAARHASRRLPRGMGYVSRDLAMQAIRLSLFCGAGRATVMGVAPIDWALLAAAGARYTNHATAFLTGVSARCARHVARTTAISLQNGVGGVAGGSGGLAQEATLEDVLQAVQAVCGSEANADAPLFESGLDSLGAVELMQQLQPYASEPLPSTLIFDHPTARLLYTALKPAHAAYQTAPHLAGVHSVASRAPAALVGLSSRLPGGACGSACAAALVSCGADGVGEVPVTRWDPPALSLPADVRARASHGGFMRGAELFDNAHFGVSRAEATMMDPQQRLLLEHGYGALHAAGAPRADLLGSATGVFLGISYTEYAPIAQARGFSVYGLTGSGHCFAAGRLSFALGLVGPCVAYDTACSAGVVACHGAGLALRHGECSQALLAGVNMMISPVTPILLSTGGMTSISGRSRTFDARADGFARAEACAAMAMRLAAAEAPTSEEVLGVAVRQDGKSASLTAPNGTAQQMLLRASLAQAGAAAESLRLLECHGTGTALGDPIEAGAFSAAVLVPLGSRPPPQATGLKANIGHAEPAAGAVGLLSLALRLRRCDAGPNAQLRLINPHVGAALRGRGCALPTQLGCLTDASRRSSPTVVAHGTVSSFGLGGTIAHAVARSVPATGQEASTVPAAVDRLVLRRRAFPWDVAVLQGGSGARAAVEKVAVVPVLEAAQVQATLLSILREFTGLNAAQPAKGSAAGPALGGNLEGPADRVPQLGTTPIIGCVASADDALADTPLLELGLDSLSLLGISSSLSSQLQVDAPSTLLLDCPTPRAAAEHIVALAAAAAADATAQSGLPNGIDSASARIVKLPQFDPLRLARDGAVRGPIRPGGRIIFYMPGAPGVCLAEFALLCARLDSHTVVALPYADLAGSCAGEPSIPAIALCLAERIVALSPAGAGFRNAVAGAPAPQQQQDEPVQTVLVGFSLGALLCRAVAAELTRRGRPPTALVLLDPLALAIPHWLTLAHGPVADTAANVLLAQVAPSLPPAMQPQLDALGVPLRRVLRAALRHSTQGKPAPTVPELVVRAAQSGHAVMAPLAWLNHPRAPRNCLPGSLRIWPSPVPPGELLSPSATRAGEAPSRVEVQVEGTHFTFLQQPRLAAQTAEHIRAFLTRVASASLEMRPQATHNCMSPCAKAPP